MPVNEKQPVSSFNVREQLLRNTRSRSSGGAECHVPSRAAKRLALLSALTLFCLVFLSPLVVGAQVDYWSPWVTNLTTTSAMVNWRGSATATGSVQYATEAYYTAHQQTFEYTVTATTQSAHQHIALTGLEPNTAYVYQALPSDSPTQFGVRAFKTMPASGPFTFLVISDSHAQEERFKHVAKAIAKHEKDALFILDGGDYASYDWEPYWSIYFQYADAMLAKFPIFHAIGNHEYHNFQDPNSAPTKADQYHWTFNVAQGGALNYSFDCANVRFVVLNSPDPKHAHGDDPQPSLSLAKNQAPWLAQQLNNTLAGTFTIHHHPIWNYGKTVSEPALQPWETLYHQYPISASFAGHVHSYQRFSVNGIPYFIIGNAGGVFTDLNPGDPRPKWYQWGDTRQLGYLKVTVDPENNTATAEEKFIGSVPSDGSTDVTVYDPPVVADAVVFPLSQIMSTINVAKIGLGTGTVTSSDSLISCGSTCAASYKKVARVSLTATPAAGSVFMGWTGACSGQGKCAVPLPPNTDVSVGAVFQKNFCAYYIAPGKQTVTYKGATVPVKVVAKGYGITNCPAPTIVNDTTWLTYTATPFTKNKGTVTVTVPKHDKTTARSGVLEIGGSSFTVTQTAKP